MIWGRGSAMMTKMKPDRMDDDCESAQMMRSHKASNGLCFVAVVEGSKLRSLNFLAGGKLERERERERESEMAKEMMKETGASPGQSQRLDP